MGLAILMNNLYIVHRFYMKLRPIYNDSNPNRYFAKPYVTNQSLFFYKIGKKYQQAIIRGINLLYHNAEENCRY